jgi:DNA-directed RNA polymerase I and III subunit RPAC1
MDNDFPHSGVAYKTLETIKKEVSIVFTSHSETESEFDIIGIDASIANAIRRILLAEVPTMAIEKCYIQDNNSIMADPILSQRMGLIPLNVDARLFEFKDPKSPPTDLNTIVFRLDVSHAEGNMSSSGILFFYIVYSSDLKWVPQGDQEEKFKNCPIQPIHEDILITKLKAGQAIQAEFHCEKGIGKTHAKWNSCVTGYRMLPTITLKEDITGNDAILLQNCFPKGTIKIENGKAYVANARKDMGSRECFRHESIKKKVELARQRDHFICKFNLILDFIESVTGMVPKDILDSSFKILAGKCQLLRAEMNEMGLVSSVMRE